MIAGRGSDTLNFERQLHAFAHDDSRVLFTGFVTGGLLAELYSNAYCYVLPSDMEGMPMSLLEAMSYGRACVTSNISECADVLAGTGLTFAKGNVHALRAALESLLATPEHAKALGDAAREHINKIYSWNNVVEKTLEIYSGTYGRKK